jgi:bifunctional UDP-N-acetylglucosamine pyrophosphorylase/glucosamine-1-phosphate N-acetyltransferase
VVGDKKRQFEDFLKNYNFKAELINQYDILSKNEYGTLCPIKCIKDIVGRDNFLAVYGDNLYSVKDLKNFKINDNFVYVGGFLHKNPQKYGVLIEDDGFLKEIIEKPKKFVSNLINTGLYKFTFEIFDKIPKISISERGEYELTDAISLLSRDKKVKIKRIEDYWLDFGNPADIMRLSKFLREHGNFKD